MAELTTAERLHLESLKKKMGVDTQIGNKNFLETAYDMLSRAKYANDITIRNKTLDKKGIKQAFPDKEKCKIYRCGNLSKANGKILVCMIIWIVARNGLKAQDNRKWKKVHYQTGHYTVFSIENDKMRIFGKKRAMLNSIHKNLKNYSLVQDRKLYDNSTGQILDKLLNIQKSQKDIEIYEVQFETDEDGKTTRMRAYSDSGDLVEKFIERNLPPEKKLIKNFIDIKFKDNADRRAVLKLTKMQNDKIFRWKEPFNELTERIGSAIGIVEGECRITSNQTDSQKIDSFFREDYISDTVRNIKYSGILRTYGDFLFIDQNHYPCLNVDNVKRTLGSIFGTEIEDLDLVKRNQIFFPTAISLNTASKQKMIRIKKDGKIVQHILLDHELPYKIGEVEAAYRFLPFAPFFALDFRKSPEDENLPGQNSMIMGSGDFVFNLKNDQNKIKERIMRISNAPLPQNERAVYFDGACKALNSLARINGELRRESQMKGSLFEGMVFCLLIELFPAKKMGGSRKADGKFLFDDEKVLYDAKNLTPKHNALWNSVKKEGLAKDVDYIVNENVTEYVFIVNEILNSDFNNVKRKIEKEVENRGRKCQVSGITIRAMKAIVKINKKDGISVNRNSLKKKILSGGLVRSVKKSEIVGTLS